MLCHPGPEGQLIQARCGVIKSRQAREIHLCSSIFAEIICSSTLGLCVPEIVSSNDLAEPLLKHPFPGL
jgi:hypothetical protein